MTGEQIARLLPYGENGEVLSPFKPRADRKRVFPGSYSKIMDMLQRMVAAGEVARFREHEGEAYVYMLKTPNMKFPGNWYNRRHELDCADVFTALYHTGKLEHWDWRWSSEELDYYQIDTYKVYYDRRFVLGGNVFFLEVDRGTEDSSQINDKIEKYLAFRDAFPHEFFYVIISVQGSRYYNLSKRIQWILDILKRKEKKAVGYQFLIADHAHLFALDPATAAVLSDPLGEVFRTAATPERLSFSDLKSAP